jgi:hypothetical protein
MNFIDYFPINRSIDYLILGLQYAQLFKLSRNRVEAITLSPNLNK